VIFTHLKPGQTSTAPLHVSVSRVLLGYYSSLMNDRTRTVISKIVWQRQSAITNTILHQTILLFFQYCYVVSLVAFCSTVVVCICHLSFESFRVSD
jgi:hypothetical protein